ncbi:PREDICTED: uncharacterized protein LOC106816151 [Priapulus caudatus]|uniref:Uncharacterized protein LOC106816151 n=1 Tax=Priapulus caudatus TaxID=37621 RepID=A0ABM1EVG9_PRICU|nr:PREDICTED: uncharacterized protein LOC106816151 [Priapulus caudatus]
MHVETGDRVALQTALGKVNEKGQGKIRLLFDLGGHKSFVTIKAAPRYELEVIRKEWLGIKTFGVESKETSLRDVVKIDITALTGGKVTRVEAYVVPNISHIQNEHIEIVKKDYPHLRNLWFSDVCKEKDELEIDVLIGADYLWCFQSGRTIRGEIGQPVAVETKVGWVLSGPLKGRISRGGSETQVNLISRENVRSEQDSIDRDIHKLWDLETLGIRESEDVSEEFADTIRFTGQRYSVKLPWKESHRTLPSNYDNSLGRMKSQVKRLKWEPEILEEYDAIVKEQLSSGITEKVVDLEPRGKVHYLPHQAVIRKEAATTKLRIVYDASAKENKMGKFTSLNDCLHVGPSHLVYARRLKYIPDDGTG